MVHKLQFKGQPNLRLDSAADPRTSDWELEECPREWVPTNQGLVLHYGPFIDGPRITSSLQL